MIAAAAAASRAPVMFAFTEPQIWIVVAVYHTECGEEHVAVARIAAWYEQDACAYLEDRLLEDVFGVPAEKVRTAWENDEDEYGERLWISEILAVSTDELNGKEILGSPAARHAFTLARGRVSDRHAAPAD